MPLSHNNKVWLFVVLFLILLSFLLPLPKNYITVCSLLAITSSGLSHPKPVTFGLWSNFDFPSVKFLVMLWRSLNE